MQRGEQDADVTGDRVTGHGAEDSGVAVTGRLWWQRWRFRAPNKFESRGYAVR